jgi:DNA topoisomerase VI subunit B
MSENCLERITFTTSRAAEYFEVRELERMTGQPATEFLVVILKELLDNAADAVEKLLRSRRPLISVHFRRRGRRLLIAVRDNGGGIPSKSVEKIQDFSTRTSDNSAYRSPTRGAQGNATKTLIGIPYALGVRAPVRYEAHGIRHLLSATVDPAGEVKPKLETREVPKRRGTLAVVPVPGKGYRLGKLRRLVRAFALFNPHIAVKTRVSRRTSQHLTRSSRERKIFTARPSSARGASGASTSPMTRRPRGGMTSRPWPN